MFPALTNCRVCFMFPALTNCRVCSRTQRSPTAAFAHDPSAHQLPRLLMFPLPSAYQLPRLFHCSQRSPIAAFAHVFCLLIFSWRRRTWRWRECWAPLSSMSSILWRWVEELRIRKYSLRIHKYELRIRILPGHCCVHKKIMWSTPYRLVLTLLWSLSC